MELAAAGLRTVFRPDAILSSPLVRARQTAEILGEEFRVPVRVIEGLGRPAHEEVLGACRELSEERVALVGHQPWMSELLSLLVTGESDRLFSVFGKGAAALVSCREAVAGAGELEWLLQPKALRALAGK